MLDWMWRRGPTARKRLVEADAEPATRRGRAMSGEYRLLHKYLVDRYANTVVLTFGEIEDLLGFKLPDLARLNQEWWTNSRPNTDRPSYENSWILASRTATANLLARTVVFERSM